MALAMEDEDVGIVHTYLIYKAWFPGLQAQHGRMVQSLVLQYMAVASVAESSKDDILGRTVDKSLVVVQCCFHEMVALGRAAGALLLH